ncbi:MAG: SHOCT domain-containing protein [Pseudomonadota bacterium]
MDGKRTIFTKILAVAMLTALLFPGRLSHAAGGSFGSWCSGPGIMGGYGMGGFGFIFMIAFWILILAGVFSAIRWIIRASGQHKDPVIRTGSNALEILKERYARGEIDQTTLETMKREIGQS